MNGVERIAKERQRQIEEGLWTAEHDGANTMGEMASAAACYAEVNQRKRRTPPEKWPWHALWWHPNDDPIRNLEKAGALIAAEIDRLLRAKETAL
ncbi:MAG: hypothetical protein AB7T38_02560 [Nitrospirales bacterium]